MKGWSAAYLALVMALAHGLWAADDLAGAARELARKTAAFAGPGAAVSVTWRNVSSLGSAEMADARDAFDPAFKSAGGALGDASSPVEAHITVSENASDYLLAEEVRKGDEKQVWFATWKRAAAAAVSAAGAVLEKKLAWEQDDPILDAAFPAGRMIVLTPTSLIWFSGQAGQWTRTVSVALPLEKSFPRDLRGRLRIVGANYAAYLPGLFCTGAWQAPVSIDCKTSAEPWVLESGSQDMLLANFTAGRNYFDGRIAAQTGARKTLDPFYSGAAVEEQGKKLWLLAMLDGKARLFDEAFNPVADIGGWGSDIAGTDSRCAAGPLVLATRPGSGGPDAVQAYRIVNRAAEPVGTPAEFRGPVTALWVSGGGSALAVTKDLAAGKYAAYLLTVVCGH
ncbi:MAG TPA: hypothetical protein VMU19_04315 [Bryobacteraceae bacterium]|nr:hypothetical protein [Bryobacteraceae bacterium]